MQIVTKALARAFPKCLLAVVCESAHKQFVNFNLKNNIQYSIVLVASVHYHQHR